MPMTLALCVVPLVVVYVALVTAWGVVIPIFVHIIIIIIIIAIAFFQSSHHDAASSVCTATTTTIVV